MKRRHSIYEKPIQASIEDHRWVCKETLALHKMQTIQQFIVDLVGDIPSASGFMTHCANLRNALRHHELHLPDEPGRTSSAKMTPIQ